MNREIPGIIKNREKEYIYIEGRPGETFYDIAGLVAVKALGVAIPDSGGIIEQKTRARLPGGERADSFILSRRHHRMEKSIRSILFIR